MKIYLVGGAVRDQLLGLQVKERDWVVVGACPEELIALGYQPIGKAFPVFLHPETHEEYALARTERKVSKGYKGFTFYTDPSVTLEQDLMRRDLTINAIAQTKSGELIDPLHGRDDLSQKLFRHVSPAFAEDPVRILRLARFATQLVDFKIHPETQKLMQSMVSAGEVDALVAERVWQELARALHNPSPGRFFEVLENCGAQQILFPQISFSGDGLHLLMQSKNITEPHLRFALLLHDVDPKKIKALVDRYRVPNQYTELALLVSKHHSEFATLDSNNAEEILSFLLSVDAIRRTDRFNAFLSIANQCHAGREKIGELLQACTVAIKNVATDSLVKENLEGNAFAVKLNALRLDAVKQMTGGERGWK